MTLRKFLTPFCLLNTSALNMSNANKSAAELMAELQNKRAERRRREEEERRIEEAEEARIAEVTRREEEEHRVAEERRLLEEEVRRRMAEKKKQQERAEVAEKMKVIRVLKAASSAPTTMGSGCWNCRANKVVCEAKE